MLHATPQERLALGVTALLLLAGAAARIAAPGPAVVEWQKSGAPVADTVKGQGMGVVRAAAEEALARNRIRSTPLAEGERIDPNRATADELDRLPRVGPALAARIVEWRTARGPFRSIADLDSVPGIGPKLAGEIERYVDLPHASATRGEPVSTGGAPLDLNRATATELDALPGIGAVLAARIVAWRDESGRFRSVDDLEKVPGIGPALRQRLAPLVRVAP